MQRFLFLLIVLSAIVSACQSKKTLVKAPSADDPLYQRAITLAHSNIIVDGHVDLPYRLGVRNFRLQREYMGIPISTDEGDFDYHRAVAGGLDAPFMSIYIPASYQKSGGANVLADSLIDMVVGIANHHADKFVIAKSVDDVKAAYKDGRIALPMGMENGAPIEKDLSRITYFKKRGISYITLTHSRDNQICDSSYDTTGTWGGLSPFGIEVVREMNRVGMMIDVSHISDRTFYQVMDLTRAPVIASHSSCRKFLPGFERNMSDDMIRKMGANGGVVMINFGSTFIDDDIRMHYNERRNALQALLSERGLTWKDAEAKAVIAQFEKDQPLYADVERVADHIDHVVQLAGIDHVGFGSDFDGVGDSLPHGIKDVSDFPNLIYVLLKRGYTEADIAKICYKNVFRVWNAVAALADRPDSSH